MDPNDRSHEFTEDDYEGLLHAHPALEDRSGDSLTVYFYRDYRLMEATLHWGRTAELSKQLPAGRQYAGLHRRMLSGVSSAILLARLAGRAEVTDEAEAIVSPVFLGHKERGVFDGLTLILRDVENSELKSKDAESLVDLVDPDTSNTFTKLSWLYLQEARANMAATIGPTKRTRSDWLEIYFAEIIRYLKNLPKVEMMEHAISLGDDFYKQGIFACDAAREAVIIAMNNSSSSGA